MHSFKKSYFQPNWNLVIATLYSAKANAAASLDVQQDPGSISTLPMSEHCCDGNAVRMCSDVTCSEPEIMHIYIGYVTICDSCLDI